MIKNLCAILLTSLLFVQFICLDTWTALQICEVQTHAEERKSNSEVFVFNSFQAQQLNLTTFNFQFTRNGKLYDIESAVWEGDSYVVTAHEDLQEEELLKELNASEKNKEDANLQWQFSKVFKAFPVVHTLCLKPNIEEKSALFPSLFLTKYTQPFFHFFIPPEKLV